MMVSFFSFLYNNCTFLKGFNNIFRNAPMNTFSQYFLKKHILKLHPPATSIAQLNLGRNV